MADEVTSRTQGAHAVAAGASEKLACLDGLRGIAVLLVILFHLRNGDAVGYHPSVAAAFAPFRYGYAGVHLFLVLSGFCLTHSLIGRARRGRPTDLRSYLAARYRRIAPPYYAAMLAYLAIPAVYLAVGHASPSAKILTIRQLTTHVLFLHGLWPDTIHAINTPFWSLSLEFQFYVVLPLLIALAGRLGVALVVALVGLLSLAWRWSLMNVAPGQDHLINGFLLGRLTEFALGMGVAYWYSSPGHWLHACGTRTFLGAATVLLATALVLAQNQHELTTDFFFGGGFAVLLMAALVSRDRCSRLRRVLEWPPLVWVGIVSYSLYLTHSLIIERSVQVYRRFVPGPVLWLDAALVVAILLGVLAAGRVFYQAVERRFVRSVDAAGTSAREARVELSSLNPPARSEPEVCRLAEPSR